MVTFGTDELSGARIQKILTNGGWPASLRQVDTGSVLVAGAQEVSGSLLSQMQAVVAAERGAIFVNKLGELVFRQRYSELQYSSSATSNGEFSYLSTASLPYQDLKFEFDDDVISNQLVVSRLGGTTQTTMQDGPSIALYGVRSESFSDLLVTTDTAARQIGEMHLTVYATPEFRPSMMKLIPESSPTTLYPQVLGRELRDRITVSFTAPGNVARTVDCLIDGIEFSITPGFWETTFYLSSTSVFDTFFMLDSAVSGKLDTNVLGA